jgi:hypothetical protein
MMQDGEEVESLMKWRGQIIMITNFGRMLRYYRRGDMMWVWQQIARIEP